MAKKDASFRSDLSGNSVLSTNLEYYLGIINQLFNMVPGTDPYNPEMGLNLAQYRFRAGKIGDRDAAYENRIREQFSKYTDIQAIDPIMLFNGDEWKVTFKISTPDATYAVMVGYEEHSLTRLIEDNNYTFS